MNLEQAINETKKYYDDHVKRNDEKEVIERFGKMFNPYNIDGLTKEKFRSFLLIKNNKHWDGIHRQVNMITSDMEKFKNTLKELLDESKPLKDRLDVLFPKGKENLIKGLGRAVLTPILLVVYPDKYGVWNSRTEAGLKNIGLYPIFKRGASFSEKYLEINKILLELSNKYEISFFKLDSVWWKLSEGHEPPEGEDDEAEEISTAFAMEKHFQRFLVENWEKTPLGENYEIFSEDGDLIGEYFNTKEVGVIDILAKEKDTNDWVVIEIKKDRTSDAVVGQLLRYMNWIEKNKKVERENVRGIIIVNKVDKNLEHSLNILKDKMPITLMVYEVKFSLIEHTL